MTTTIKALAYTDANDESEQLEAPTVNDLLALADERGMLWMQIGGTLIGKTIMGTWAKAW